MDKIDKKFLEQLLITCGKMSLDHSEKLTIINKGGNKGFATNADTLIGQFIHDELTKKYPLDSIICEDGPQHKLGTSNYVWYVDPLDGTTNYIHSLPFFAVSISCYDKKNAFFVASGIYIPYFNQLFTANGTEPTLYNGKKIHVSSNTTIKNSLVLTGLSVGIKKNSQEAKTFMNISSLSAGTRRSGSAAFDLCYVAAGFADAYYHANIMPWDMAAGCHLIKNAGGYVSNIGDINTFDLTGRTLLATNGKVHKNLNKELSNYEN